MSWISYLNMPSNYDKWSNSKLVYEQCLRKHKECSNGMNDCIRSGHSRFEFENSAQNKLIREMLQKTD